MTSRLTWRIADMEMAATVEADSLPPSWVGAFRSHFSKGLRSEVDLELELTPRPGWINPNYEDGLDTRQEEGDTRTIFMDRPGFSGILKDLGGARFRGVFDVNCDGSASLGILLRAGLSFLCEQTGRLLLHASAVVRDGRTWVFCGPSGSGKSTIATRLAGKGRVVAVDRVVLQVEGEEIIASSTPFSDEEGVLSGSSKGRCGGIFFIRQSTSTRLNRLDPAKTVGMLLRETMWFSREAHRIERGMDTLAAVAQSGMVFDLEFTLDESLWTEIERAGLRAGGKESTR